MSEHDIDVLLRWCRRCGRPESEIFNDDLLYCDGLHGVIHARYKEALQRARDIFDPIVRSIFNGDA